MVKEIPLLMQPGLVRASILGNKTETRRLSGLHKINERPEAWRYDGPNRNGDHIFTDVHGIITGHDPQDCTYILKCPFGAVDDFLYVRENWNKDGYGGFLYAADYGIREHMRWRPSIHLPKFASRLWLQVAEIKVERLHDITDEGSQAEGTGFYDVLAYEALWISIHGHLSWEANPWVWVVKYQVMSTTGRPEILDRTEVANA